MALATPDFLQVKTYSAKALRAMLMDRSIQSGVYGAGDIMPTQRLAGATMSVDVAAGSAWVLGTTSSRQGAYHAYNDAPLNVSIASNASGNPRIDQVVLHVYDSIDGAAASDTAAIEVIQGVATAGATLANRTGASALPANCLLLADVLVANGAASITNSVIRDRRQWARGVNFLVHRTTNASAGSDYTTTSASFVSIDLGNLGVRLECSGVMMKVRAAGRWQNTVAANRVVMELFMDGVNAALGGPYVNPGSPNVPEDFYHEWTFTPPAGSHVFEPRWLVFGGTGTLLAQSSAPFQFAGEEVLRQSTVNNATTSG